MAVLLFTVKLIVSCGLLYGYYHFFLRNQLFHRYNRFYLLAAALFSFILPFINIPVNLFSFNQQHTGFIRTLKVINANGWEEPVIIYARNNQWSKWLTVQSTLYLIYIAGAIASAIVLFRSLAWINQLRKKYTHEVIDQLKIYNTTEPGTPFSFFRSIFWDNTISLDDKRGQQIFRHELFHVKEKHSADALLMEIICCIGWFNPFFHLIKKEIKAIHEFLADEYAVSANDRYDYAELLVSHAITQKTLGITHPFFHNQIKRRITMITQSNLIRHSGYISRIMALPLLFLLVSAFAVKLTNKPLSGIAARHAYKNTTVVIDAGHGGVFRGANNIGMAEKDINLEISQKIKQLSAEYNVNIVLTRNNDKLVGNATNLREDLLNRVTISDQAKPDLFISIHVNYTLEKNSTYTGFQAYISGKNENGKTRRFASAILGELKNIYTTDETIKQREEGLVVLDKTTYPSILLECGYLNNPKDVAFITNSTNQEKIARKILEGIVKYSNAQTAGTANIQPEQVNSDTLSAEALDKINMDDIKSVDTDLHTNLATIYFKNGSVKFAWAKEMNDYFAANNIDTLPHGTQKHAKDTTSTVIFTKVEIEPDYPGGQAGWIEYLTKNLKYPQDAIKKEVQGTVVIQFIVDQQGKISDVKAISGPEILRAASIKVIKESGVWLSAMQNGKKVKAYKRQPITYKLS
ncbi:MAG TPA: N-acetylmuramoyl-L-alanine amidase [Chitinophagaceae bacterium]|nr:N-acetylmuramoyl-L-alanine amidase [Chitinophagaceae bacterium]